MWRSWLRCWKLICTIELLLICPLLELGQPPIVLPPSFRVLIVEQGDGGRMLMIKLTRLSFCSCVISLQLLLGLLLAFLAPHHCTHRGRISDNTGVSVAITVRNLRHNRNVRLHQRLHIQHHNLEWWLHVSITWSLPGLHSDMHRRFTSESLIADFEFVQNLNCLHNQLRKCTMWPGHLTWVPLRLRQGITGLHRCSQTLEIFALLWPSYCPRPCLAPLYQGAPIYTQSLMNYLPYLIL